MMAANVALAELRDIVLPLVGLANAGVLANQQTMQFIALHGLVSVEGFNLLEPYQAKRFG